MQVWRGQLSFQVPADSSIQSPAGCSSLRTMLAGSCRQGMCTQEKEDSYQSSFLLPMKQMHLAWAEMSLTGGLTCVSCWALWARKSKGFTSPMSLLRPVVAATLLSISAHSPARIGVANDVPASPNWQIGGHIPP